MSRIEHTIQSCKSPHELLTGISVYGMAAGKLLRYRPTRIKRISVSPVTVKRPLEEHRSITDVTTSSTYAV